MAKMVLDPVRAGLGAFALLQSFHNVAQGCKNIGAF
jgi:hypothetical protein